MENISKNYILEKLSTDKVKDKFIASGISHLSLFGSYARGDNTKNSDLDLCIELAQNNKVTIGVLEELQDFLKTEIDISKVDFTTKKSLNNYLKGYIQKDLIVIF